MASSLVQSPLVISLLSIIGATVIGIDCKFKYQNKTFEKKQNIDILNKTQTKLEYVNSCNGNLTESEYLEIFKELKTVL